MSLWNKIVSSALMVWGSIFGAAGTPVAMNPSSFVPQLPLVQDVVQDAAFNETGTQLSGEDMSPESRSVSPTSLSVEEYEAGLMTEQAPAEEPVVRELHAARISADTYEDARVAFAIPKGYEVHMSTSTAATSAATSVATSTAASTTTPATPTLFNTHIEVVKPEAVSTSPGLAKGELASIRVDVLANPEKMSARAWVHAQAQFDDESEITEYQFAGRTGVQWVPPARAHRAEAVALSANGFIIRVQHAFETEEEQEAFNELLSSFTIQGE